MKKEIIKKELFTNELISCECGHCNEKLWKYRIENGKLRLDRPRRFIRGHLLRGRKHTDEHRKHNAEARLGKKYPEEHRKNISKGITGSGNPMYGKHHSTETKLKIGKANSKDIVGYSRLHYKIRRLLPRPEFCKMCLIKPSYEVACVTYIYNMDLKNWMWVCRSCHKKYDHKMRN